MKLPHDDARRELDSVVINIELLLLFNLACAFAIWRWPHLSIARSGHLWLMSAQIVLFIAYLISTGRYISAMADLAFCSEPPMVIMISVSDFLTNVVAFTSAYNWFHM
jgi:hypothetical protein